MASDHDLFGKLYGTLYNGYKGLRAVVSVVASLSCPQLSVNYCRAVLAYCGK